MFLDSIRIIALLACLLIQPSSASVFVQCPGDTDGDAIIDTPDPQHPRAKCMHLSSGDGFVTMADGSEMYILGFADVTGLTPEQALTDGLLAASFPAPTIILDEGDEFYLTLTNVGMALRPDLFDAHTVHWHGFPNAAPVFDGLPDSGIAINMGASLTYYYHVVTPGTFMYHCHVEAAEHMQMGMLGNLYVRPAQNGSAFTYQGRTYTQFVYNDGDGSTGYDVEYAIQIGSFDPEFHAASETVQPLPFAHMKDTYPMLNGRGYPDTVNPNALPAPQANGGLVSQKQSALITAKQGERVLLRLSNLNITRFYTLASLSLPMQVVGKDAKLLRGPEGKNLFYETQSVTLGGGESVDVILDTQLISPGRYFLYTTNLNYLSNDGEDFGGMMTEIIIEAGENA
ncbi:MAG: multicopper oxidase domain-containing protein [Pseudomonadota bacterium]|nr:multicopper oxidase domain-containing protein [Pseudomonadota bacterium]